MGGFLADKKVDGEICNETSGTPCFSCNNLAPNAHGWAAIIVSLSASASKRSNKDGILTATAFHNVFNNVRELDENLPHPIYPSVAGQQPLDRPLPMIAEYPRAYYVIFKGLQIGVFYDIW